MHIIVSPDSFKGSLDAATVAKTIAEAIHAAQPSFTVTKLPVADGGEGTLDALVAATNGHYIQTTVQDPLHRPIETCYGILGNGSTYMIEIAKASGLSHLSVEERDPLLATTYGTGQLIRHALDSGARHFIIGIGGSATNDGGLGMLRALGMKFYDATQREITVPRDLQRLVRLDDTHFDQRIAACTFMIACDVDTPFVGPNGASAIFGPQKGAPPSTVDLLDINLTHFANKIAETGRIALHYLAGAGAAGGLGGAFLAFFPATLHAGIDVVLDAIQMDEALAQADVILTGEGKSDKQTLAGKAAMGILKRANKFGVRTILLAAIIEDRDALQNYFDEMYALVEGTITAEMTRANPKKYIYDKVMEIMTTY